MRVYTTSSLLLQNEHLREMRKLVEDLLACEYINECSAEQTL